MIDNTTIASYCRIAKRIIDLFKLMFFNLVSLSIPLVQVVIQKASIELDDWPFLY